MNRDSAKGRAGEVFAAFLKLGLTSFGGPIAHLGYFRNEFVERRKWLDETTYAELVCDGRSRIHGTDCRRFPARPQARRGCGRRTAHLGPVPTPPPPPPPPCPPP